MEKLYHDMSIDIFIQGKQGLSPRSGQEPIDELIGEEFDRR